MVKCKDCGTEYEGEFCPECGLSAERICPQCGKKGESAAHFCNVCGYAFDAKHAADVSFGRDELVKTANAMATDKIIATFFKYAVVGLFGLLSLLMFAFYAAPADQDPLGLGLSSGNLYARAFNWITGNYEIYMMTVDGVQTVDYVKFVACILLGLMPLLGVFFLITIICMAFTGNKKMKKLETGTLFYTLLYIAVAAYLMIDAQNTGMKIGAAPILMAAFSSVTFILEIILLLLRKSFYRRCPEYDNLS